MLEVTSNISTYLDCFELEKFEPVDSEEQLTKRGLELLETNQLWGGLVRTNICFLNVKMFKMTSQVFVGLAPGQQELPKFVTYKIRIDADKVRLKKERIRKTHILSPRWTAQRDTRTD